MELVLAHGRSYRLRTWFEAPAQDARPAPFAASLIATLGTDFYAAMMFRRALDRLDGMVGALDGHELRARLERAIRDGQLVLEEIVEAHVPRIAAAAEREIDERAVETEDEWVEFRFEYPDRTPVSGLDYVLIDPDRNESAGTLGANGSITRRGIRRGGYTVVVGEVEAAFFSHQRRACDDELEVTARTPGYPDGTPAKVKLYRELRESSDQVLAEVDAEVVGDRVRAVLHYDYAGDEALAAETGVIHLIAEVSVGDGRSWAKTEPLAVALKTIQRVAWSSERVERGAPVDLVVETAAYPEGATAHVEIWRLGWISGDEKVADVGPLPITRGRVVARGAYGRAGADFTIEEAGEHYAIATIEDGVTRTRRSELVWCAWTEADEDREEDSAEDETAERRAEAA